MRPFVLVGFVYLLTLTAAVYFSAQQTLAIGCVCLIICSFLFLFGRAKRLAVGLVVAAAALGSFSVWTQTKVVPVEVMDEKDAVFTGTICEIPENAYGKYYYIIEVDSIEMENAPDVGKIRMSARNALEVEPYDKIRGRAHFFLPTEDFGFDKRSYYISKGIFLSAYLYEYEEKQIFPAESLPLYAYALKARTALSNSLYEQMSKEEAGLAVGVLLGDKSGISEEIEEAFRVSGVSHLLAVSGMHMAAIYEMFVLLLRKILRLPEKLTCLAAMAVIAAFMAITGFAPSVVRSGLMYLIYLAGLILSRRADSLNSLGASVFLMCLVNPYAAADVGLLLSFAATASLILFSGKMSHFFRRHLPLQGRPPKGQKRFHPRRATAGLIRRLSDSVATTITATLGTAPIVMLSFGTFSTIFLPANLLLLFPSTLLLEFSALAALIHLIPILAPLAAVFAFLAEILARYSHFCAESLAKIPYASVYVPSHVVNIWIVGTAILFAMAVLLGKKRGAYGAAGICSAILLAVGIVANRPFPDVTRLSVIDVSDGLSVLVEKNGSSALLGADSYSSANISPFLQEEWVRTLNFFQISGMEEDEYGAAADIIQKFSPERAAVPEDAMVNVFLLEAFDSWDGELICKDRFHVDLWEGAAAEACYAKDGNCTFLVLDGIEVLICGRDCEIENVPEQWLSPDLLICSELPKDAENIEESLTILSATKELSEEIMEDAPEGVYLSTAQEGSLVFDISNRRMKMRRQS